MAIEGLGELFPPDLHAPDILALDHFLTDLPPTNLTFNSANNIIENPSREISERLMRIKDAARRLVYARGTFIEQASVFKEVVAKSPETIASLPEELRSPVMELIGRLGQTD